MEYGIQRRSIYLVPPADSDLSWLFAQFDEPEVFEMFGFMKPSHARVMRAYRTGNLVVGILHRVTTRARIGFVVLFPPAGELDFWEFGYAIPNTKDRDGFGALNATDAMATYAFDHLRVEKVGWRTREDNRAADAVVRRLGYRPRETRLIDGHSYTFYVLDTEGWQLRRQKLERWEAENPSGIGSAFVTLMPPYTPTLPQSEVDATSASPRSDSTGPKRGR